MRKRKPMLPIGDGEELTVFTTRIKEKHLRFIKTESFACDMSIQEVLGDIIQDEMDRLEKQMLKGGKRGESDS